MKYPTLRQPRLCRILPYIVVLGGYILPLVVLIKLNISETPKIFACLALSLCFIIYLFRNFMFLMVLDMCFASLCNWFTARTQFELPKGFNEKSLIKSVNRFGIECRPTKLEPIPYMQRYKFNQPFTVYSKGIEKVISVYKPERLDKETYQAIYRSATSNSKALIGTKKARFLDKQQKESPLNRVTIIYILTKEIEESFETDIYQTLCKASGDGFDVSILPCVIDTKKRLCYFNSERVGYIGFQYPVKDRGIKLIKKQVFGGKPPLDNEHYISAPGIEKDLDESLWSFWRSMKKELITDEKNRKKIFGSMSVAEIKMIDDCVYLKWSDERGIYRYVTFDDKNKIVTMNHIAYYDYPKTNNISKGDLKKMKSLLSDYFAKLGYKVVYVDR